SPARLNGDMAPISAELRELVERALQEDAPSGDLSSELTVPESVMCRAELRAKAEGVLAGTAAVQAAFDLAGDQDGLGPVEVTWKHADADLVRSGDVLAVVAGAARAGLRAERVAINFLAPLSGVATPPPAFVEGARAAGDLCSRET